MLNYIYREAYTHGAYRKYVALLILAVRFEYTLKRACESVE